MTPLEHTLNDLLFGEPEPVREATFAIIGTCLQPSKPSSLLISKNTILLRL
jgi:hypothetical protein